MGKFKGIVLKWGSLLASLALLVGVTASSQVCWWWFHQPKVPQGMDKFIK